MINALFVKILLEALKKLLIHKKVYIYINKNVVLFYKVSSFMFSWYYENADDDIMVFEVSIFPGGPFFLNLSTTMIYSFKKAFLSKYSLLFEIVVHNV